MICDRKLLGLKEAVAKVGVGLWDILQEETSLQHPKTSKAWANKQSLKDLRECLEIPDHGEGGIDPQEGAIDFGFESADVSLYFMQSEDDLRWDDAVSDTNHDDFKTSVLMISHLVNEWEEENIQCTQLFHLVFRFDAGCNVL